MTGQKYRPAREPARQNIILTGFMGVGKSSVGRLLAAKLGRKFVDFDSLIEQREGRTINRIFADEREQEQIFAACQPGSCSSGGNCPDPQGCPFIMKMPRTYSLTLYDDE